MKRCVSLFLALFLALLLAFTPLSPLVNTPLAPVTAAQANTTDDLKQCLEVVKDGTEIAAQVIDALANPQFLACASAASSGDVIMIATMAAMTAFWILEPDSFSDVGSCQGLISGLITKVIAAGLDLAMESWGALKDMIRSVFGDEGVDLIKELAGALGASGEDSSVAAQQAAGAGEAAAKQGEQAGKEELKKLADEAAKKLWEFIPPNVKLYFDCGCQVAGTVAVVTKGLEKIAGNLGACADVAKNPAKLVEEFANDPIGTIKLLDEAICAGIDGAFDGFCSSVKKYLETAKEIADAICELTGTCLVLDAAYEEAKCWISGGCHQEGTPMTPQPCPTDPQTGVAIFVPEAATIGAAYLTCVCSPPLGKVRKNQYAAGPLGGSDQWGYTCETCPDGQGRNADGYCVKCPLGKKQNKDDGTCGIDFSCPAGWFYNNTNTDCYTCGADEIKKADNSGCRPVCHNGTEYSLLWNACVCPDGMLLAGGSCEKPTGCSGIAGAKLDPATNTCVRQCEQPGTVLNTHNSSDASFWSCDPCGAGQIAANNQCTTCPAGTEADGNNNCVPVCKAGWVANPQPSATVQQLLDALVPSASSAAIPGVQALNPNISPNLQSSPSGAGRSRARSGSSGALLVTDSKCIACEENEQAVSKTDSGIGYSITTVACVACPEGEVSKRGSTACHKPLHFEVIAGLRPTTTPVKLAPAGPNSTVPLQIEPPCPQGQVATTAGCQPAKGNERMVVPGTPAPGATVTTIPSKAEPPQNVKGSVVPLKGKGNDGSVCPEGQAMTTSGGCQPAKGVKGYVVPLEGKGKGKGSVCPEGQAMTTSGGCQPAKTVKGYAVPLADKPKAGGACPQGQSMTTTGGCQPSGGIKGKLVPLKKNAAKPGPGSGSVAPALPSSTQIGSSPSRALRPPPPPTPSPPRPMPGAGRSSR